MKVRGSVSAATSHTSQPAQALMANRKPQTTGKAQFGGVHDGLFSPAYQAPGLNRLPLDAAARLRPTKTATAIHMLVSMARS